MTDGYKIKKVRIWVNGVEKQIYPATWKPNANTMLYCPFNNNITDYSGNSVTLTSTGTGFTDIKSGGNKCVQITSVTGYITGPGGLMSSIGTGDFAVSFWVKPVSSTGPVCVFDNRYEGGSYPGCQMFMVYSTNSWLTANNQVLFFMTSVYKPSTSITCSSLNGSWHHFCFTRLNGTCYSYIDGVSSAPSFTDNTSLASNNYLRILNRGDNSGQRWSSTGACMSELIVEKVGWKSDFVSDYYHQTWNAYHTVASGAGIK